MRLQFLVVFLVLLSGGCQKNAEPSTVAHASAAQQEDKPRVERNNPNRKFQLAELERTKISFPGGEIEAWVMDEAEKKKEGMMWLSDEEVGTRDGMLFVFKASDLMSFWMRNTLIPLDIAFIDSTGKVLNIEKGVPLDEDTQIRSHGLAKYVLEMKEGSTQKVGIYPGTVLKISEDLKAKD